MNQNDCSKVYEYIAFIVKFTSFIFQFIYLMILIMYSTNQILRKNKYNFDNKYKYDMDQQFHQMKRIFFIDKCLLNSFLKQSPLLVRCCQLKCHNDLLHIVSILSKLHTKIW